MKPLLIALVTIVFLTNAVVLSSFTHPVFAQTTTPSDSPRDNGSNNQTISIVGVLVLGGLLLAAIFDNEPTPEVVDPEPLTITPTPTTSF